MALPTTVTELRSFLGSMGFVRTFMPLYSQVSHVLERLTGCLTRREAQRTPVQWTKAAVLAFIKIKYTLIRFAYSYIIDPEASLFIYADSSLTAIGAALTQEIKGVLLPVGCMLKSLNPTQTRCPIFSKELYSCFMAVKYFSAEISGRQVTMYNVHYALVQQYNPAPLQSNFASEQRRMRMMGELSYRGVKLVHTPGRENPLADFLSRINQDQNCPIS